MTRIFFLISAVFSNMAKGQDQIYLNGFESCTASSNRPQMDPGISRICWSEFLMPDGQPPGPSDVVTIAADQRMILDTNTNIEGLVVMGELFVDDRGLSSQMIEMTSGWVVVVGGGTFNVGWSHAQFEGQFELTLSGDNPDQDINLQDFGGPNMTIMDQDAFLMVMGAGSEFEVFADDALKRSWTQLRNTANADDQSIQVEHATGWEVGDVIALASTDYDLNQAEVRTIEAISNDGRDIQLSEPLEFMHYGSIDRYYNDERHWDLDMRGEVGLLSRDVRFTGNEIAGDTRYGGHTMVMNNASMRISGAEFTHMGQEGILGKYPLHWHLLGNVDGQFIRHSSIHHTFNKGLTIHGTNNAHLTENVIFETIGHSYFFENGQETGNVLTNNLGFNTRLSDSAEIASDPDDFKEVSTYWVENVDNILVGNHAGGSEKHGFFYDAGNEEAGPTEFISNTTHSNKIRGFFLNHRGFIGDGNPTGSPAEPQKVKPWEVVDLTVYKTSTRGVYVRGVEGDFRELKIAEVHQGTRFRLNQTIHDSLIVGRSNNIGTPIRDIEIAAGRSLPENESGTIKGHMIYDGPHGLSNVHLTGFGEGDDSAIGLTNAVHKVLSHYTEGLTFGADTPYEKRLYIGGNNVILFDNIAKGMIDIDGSLTGIAGSTITHIIGDNNDFNTTPGFISEPDWGANVNTSGNFASLRVDPYVSDEENDGRNYNNDSIGEDRLTIRRSDGLVAAGFQKQAGVLTNSQYTYELDFEGGPDEFRMWFSDAPWGSATIIRLDAVPEDTKLTTAHPYTQERLPVREVSTFNFLEQSPDTAAFRDGDYVWVKLVGQMAHGYMWPQPRSTVDDQLLSGVVVMVDTSDPVDMNNLVFDNPSTNDTLGPPPYADIQPELDLRLFLVDAQSGDRITRLTNGDSIDGVNLRDGLYRLEVGSAGGINRVRIGIEGTQVSSDNNRPFYATFDHEVIINPSLSTDGEMLVSIQAYSDDTNESILASEVIRLIVDH